MIAQTDRTTRRRQRLGVTEQDDPAVHRLRLRCELRRLRHAAGLRQEDVAQRLEWSPSKMLRIEAGISRVGITDLRVLLDLYGVADVDVREELVTAGRAARRRSWRDEHRAHMDEHLAALCEYEAAAVGIRLWQTQTVPELMRTADYARALASVVHGSAEKREHEISVEMLRQRVLRPASDGPRVVCLLDESVLYRRVGGGHVMACQLRALLLCASLPHITVQIVPFSAETHFGLGRSFALYEMPAEVSGVGVRQVLSHAAQTRRTVIADRATEISHYAAGFSDIQNQALPVDESVTMIDNAAARTAR